MEDQPYINTQTHLDDQLLYFQKDISKIKTFISQSIIGQQDLIDSLFVSMLCNGHVLLEGVPGLAKTLIVKTLASSLQGKFSRIQFTPDLMPSDILGTTIYDQQKHDFYTYKGPIFANFVLADEINRSPAKVQSALLEVMEEHQISIGNDFFTLDKPFLVLATQNPLDQEGTYPLPEAQLDRFLMKILIDYPNFDQEAQIIDKHFSISNPNNDAEVQSLVSLSSITAMQDFIKFIYLDEKLKNYILQIIFATRFPKINLPTLGLEQYISHGVSPRGTIQLVWASKARAFLNGRSFVLPMDIHQVVKQVLRHRLGLSYKAEAENVKADDLIDKIISHVELI